MTTVLITLGAVAMFFGALAIGFNIGVKAAYSAVSDVARKKLNDADYEVFMRLFTRVTE